MIPHFQLPSLSFWRRRKNDVDLETLFIHPEKEKSTATEKERLAETSAAKDTHTQKKTVPPEEYQSEIFADDPTETAPQRGLSFFQTAGKENVVFSGTGTAQTEENFSAENSSLFLRENAMPEKKSDTQLDAAIGALTACARGQLRYLKKNYDLLKTQTEERYFN